VSLDASVNQSPPRSARSPGVRRRLLTRVSLAVLLSVALVALVDMSEVFRVLSNIPLELLAVVLLLLSADRVAMGLKWRHLVNGIRGPLRISDAIAIYYQSGFAALLLPTSVGGEVLRGLLGRRAGVPGHMVVASMVLEKLVAAVSSVVLAVLGTGFMLGATETPLSGVLLALVGGSVVAVLAALVAAGSRRLHQRAGQILRRWVPERISRELDQLSAKIVDYGRRPALLRRNLIFNLGEHLLQFFVLYVLGVAIGIELGLLPFLAVTSVVMLVKRTAGFFESWGVAEGAGILLYSLFGVPQTLSVALAVGLWATSIMAALPGGYLLCRNGLGLLYSGDDPAFAPVSR